jgi:hypothetical protein
MAFENSDGLHSHLAAAIGTNSISPLLAYSNTLMSTAYNTDTA